MSDDQVNISFFNRFSLAARFTILVSLTLAAGYIAFFLVSGSQANEIETQLAKTIEEILPDAGHSKHLRAVVKEQFDAFRWKIDLTIFILFALIVFLIYFTFVKLVRLRLRYLDEKFKAIVEGNGDLTQRVEVKSKDSIDRLARQFNKLLDKLHRTMSQFTTDTARVADSSNKVSQLIQSSAKEISRQQGDLHQIASAMNEVTASIDEVAKNAANAAESAKSADQKTASGKEVVDQTITTIRTLAEDVTGANTVIQNLKTSTEEINSILGMIKGIADQTNLLALNAAIEAARAGDLGRGFAVVADEVRTLAIRTQSSVSEIENKINHLVENAGQAANVMDRSYQNAQKGLENASRAGDEFETIAQTVAAISIKITQIAAATEQQSVTVKEMDKSIVQIGQSAQTTTENVKNITSEADELSKLATELEALVSQFRT